MNSKFRIAKAAGFTAAVIALAAPVAATHSWNGYHWARTSGTQLSVPVGDNVTTAWDSYLRTAITDWNKSSMIESPLATGMTSRTTCNPVSGRIEVCNYTYGSTGWLGIAQIWLSGGHISQGTTKLNDTYYNTATYNTPAWRAAVTCQELGHDYGLGHQDEDMSTDLTTSCMDYTNRPEGNEHPDSHDYNQLYSIYNHTESTSTASTTALTPSQAAGGNAPAEWGRAVGYTRDGRPNVFVQDIGNGVKKVTHVTWAPDAGPRRERTH